MKYLLSIVLLVLFLATGCTSLEVDSNSDVEFIEISNVSSDEDFIRKSPTIMASNESANGIYYLNLGESILLANGDSLDFDGANLNDSGESVLLSLNGDSVVLDEGDITFKFISSGIAIYVKDLFIQDIPVVSADANIIIFTVSDTVTFDAQGLLIQNESAPSNAPDSIIDITDKRVVLYGDVPIVFDKDKNLSISNDISLRYTGDTASPYVIQFKSNALENFMPENEGTTKYYVFDNYTFFEEENKDVGILY